MHRIESFLAARVFDAAQIVGLRIYFVSNLSGRLSLYGMDYGGSVPEPLLPPHIAMQNPHLLDGLAFAVFPKLGKIVVMLDQDGDENYRPMIIPSGGGYPEPLFAEEFSQARVHLVHCDLEKGLAWFQAESIIEPVYTAYHADLNKGLLTPLGSSTYGARVHTTSRDSYTTVMVDSYTNGDDVIFLREQGVDDWRVLYGKPMDQRLPDEQVPLTGVLSADFTGDDRGLLLCCAVFEDCYGPAYLDLRRPGELHPVSVIGVRHSGIGEMVRVIRLDGERYAVEYNIDGCSWLYEATYDPQKLQLHLGRVYAGEKPPLVNGVLVSWRYDPAGDRFALVFSTATSPTQIFTVECTARMRVTPHTRERVLGIAANQLSGGEDASFTSYDGTRVSARLYLPSADLGYQGARPLVYYVHGGPQGQERPDFAWFSMPLIQFLTLNGFAVFVPNARGSTGYGLAYAKQVDRDWGGRDRLDHVHALKVLGEDTRVDTSRAGVVGRSYGGYMSLTLAARHPELWSAAVDMFGPYDLLTFSERIPETWKPYFYLSIGDSRIPEQRADLIDRSPKTHIGRITCPLLVIQGKNDPRVVEQESRDLVDYLRSMSRPVDYLMFENEGHDVLKMENRVRCYNAITDFFRLTLKP